MENLTQTRILLDRITSSPSLVICVIGIHGGGGETTDEVFNRKVADIQKVGYTIWLTQSHGAKTKSIQTMWSKSSEGYVAFVDPSTRGGTNPPKHHTPAQYYSEDGALWIPLPPKMSPVTGNLRREVCGLFFDQLERCNEKEDLDLWDYSDHFEKNLPIISRLGCSTLCACKQYTGEHPDKMMSHIRRIVAVGRLLRPFGVWLR